MVNLEEKKCELTCQVWARDQTDDLLTLRNSMDFSSYLHNRPENQTPAKTTLKQLNNKKEIHSQNMATGFLVKSGSDVDAVVVVVVVVVFIPAFE